MRRARVPSFEPTVARSPRDCPGCGSQRTLPFFELAAIPANSCILLDTAEQARRCPRGRLLLCLCEDCGFVGNHTFDRKLTEYSERYEETQGFSPTFRRYLEGLAQQLIDDLGLEGRRIIEIGCGKGEFLALLSARAGAEGIGFDPAFRADRRPDVPGSRVRYLSELYSEAWSHLDADLYLSRMTLEHIAEVGEFLAMLRRTIGDRPDTRLYCQIPDFARILREGLFCDVIYEHCSYLCRESLELVHRRAGFEVISTHIGFGGQHLGLIAQPGDPVRDPADLGALRRLACEFSRTCAGRARVWIERLERAAGAKERVVLWGSGSKATAFLTSLGIDEGIDQVVDINPYRHGRFMAGTGQPIVAPEALLETRPDHVIIMNPIYRYEIAHALAELGLSPQLHLME